MAENFALQRERRPVAWAIELARSFVEAQQTALVCAHTRHCREHAVVVHHEPDRRRGGESGDLTVGEVAGRYDRIPHAFVGNELL